MSTRAILARKTATGFQGRYHHMDSHPFSLGATLYEQYHLHFEHQLPAMLRLLLDEHSGWSTLAGRDFTLQPGYTHFTYDDVPYPGLPDNLDELKKDEGAYYSAIRTYEREVDLYNAGRDQAYGRYKKSDDARRPVCYCHGHRGEDMSYITSFGEAIDYKYLYIIDAEKESMEVWKRKDSGFSPTLKSTRWELAGIVDLNADEPDWRALF